MDLKGGLRTRVLNGYETGEVRHLHFTRADSRPL